MFEKSPISVLILSFVTFGIYGIIWMYKCSEEMKQRGVELPSFILVFIPIAQFLFIWKFYQGVEKLSNGEHTASMLFLFSLLGPLALVSFWQTQTTFNKVAGVAG
ncbi:hypothetical protein DB30_06204 [Enhygromyxa salina]|uniref:DUF4234 domain-containing protein n=1 Tax=Enhygromyxa salina TaxID=215803 RepID=A0A0C2D484_9BACT|nr:DUF4234 domain-containing protein [Enhygromyxa salina]KIG14902.1 hypothetical protein DB30_06204 [Enhygromyxa salina]